MPAPTIKKEEITEVIKEITQQPIIQQPSWVVYVPEILKMGQEFIVGLRNPKNNLPNQFQVPQNQVQQQNQVPQQPSEEDLKKQKDLETEFLKSDESFLIRQEEIDQLRILFNQKFEEQQKDFKEYVANKNNPALFNKKLETKVENLNHDITSIKEMLIKLTNQNQNNNNQSSEKKRGN